MGIATVRGEFTEFEGTLEIGEDLSSARSTAPSRPSRSTPTSRSATSTCARPTSSTPPSTRSFSFESTSIEALDEEEFRITGQLTIHGVTNEIVLHAEVQGTDIDPWGNERVGLEVTGQLSRGDYGMKFNQALGSGNMLVADKVKLALDISAVKQSAVASRRCRPARIAAGRRRRPTRQRCPSPTTDGPRSPPTRARRLARAARGSRARHAAARRPDARRTRALAVGLRGPHVPGRRARAPHAHVRDRRAGPPQPQRLHAPGRPPGRAGLRHPMRRRLRRSRPVRPAD